MKAHELRYVAVAMILSVGIAAGIAFPLGPWGFTAYLATFYVIYQNTDWLNRAIERIANGKEREK